MTTMAKWVLVLVVGAGIAASSGLAGQGLSKVAVGFDVKRIPPPDPKRGKPVARVFDEYLYSSQLGDPAGQRGNTAFLPYAGASIFGLLTDPAGHGPLPAAAALVAWKVEDITWSIDGFVFTRLMQRFTKDRTIAATLLEVEQYVTYMMKNTQKELSIVNRNGKIDKAVMKAAFQDLGRRAVVQWKCSRDLYELYGGQVIFQQANPFEPVGAYRKFFEEMEERQCFEIFGVRERASFWEYYIREYTITVSPDRINYDKPWWLLKQ